MQPKKNIEDLAIFGGAPLFTTPKSTSNLLRPNFDIFLNYSKLFFEEKRYTNNGPNVRLLEQKLAEFHKTDYCITFCSGFWALAMTIKALSPKGKTEIVMPSLTYRRMDDIAAWVNLKPHFCEVEHSTLAMSKETVEPCLNDNTAMILGVHPIVNCCDITGLETLAAKYNIPLVFDSVESVYEWGPSGKVGGFGNAEAFSLHACKLLNGFGGGYLTTNDDNLAKHLKSARTFGFIGQDEITTAGGMNAKLNEVHAAMALASLDGIEEQISLNLARYNLYEFLIGEFAGLRLLKFNDDYKSGFKNIVVEILSEWPFTRVETLAFLNAENILARAYYHPPLHQKPPAYPFVDSKLPITDSLTERFMNLPCGQLVSNNDIKEIVQILEFINLNSDMITNCLKKNGLIQNEVN